VSLACYKEANPTVRNVAYASLVETDRFHSFALAAAPNAAAVANYCDHVEHNEAAATEWVIAAAQELARLAFGMAEAAGRDLVHLYAERLGAIEARNVLARPGGFDGHSSALAAETWRDLQLVQVDHDRCYHADVIGISKGEQLRHYALHLTKIVGAFADAHDVDELINRRLPDTLLFAIKLHTVMGRRLSDDPLPRLARAGAAAAAS
jgi:hypothetical protein